MVEGSKEIGRYEVEWGLKLQEVPQFAVGFVKGL